MYSAKKLGKSKTVQANTAAQIVAILAMIGGSELIQSHPVLSLWFAALLPVANIALRFFTKEPIEVGGQSYRYSPTQAKEFWRSSVFWTNAAFFVLAVVGALLGSDLVKEYPQAATAFLTIQAVANLVLRIFKTDGPLKPVLN